MPDSIKPTGYRKHSEEDYSEAYARMFPQGTAWPRQLDTVFMRFISGIAALFARPVEENADILLMRESDPRITIDLLPDWERVAGLPDPCFDPNEPLSMQTRRDLLIERLTIEGGASRQFFIALADRLGYEIEIIERAPFMVGVSRVGETLDEMGYWRWELGPPEIRFNWYVRVLSRRLVYFRVGESQVGVDRLLSISLATDLECIIRRWKPAHTHVIFDYSHENT